MLKALSNVHLSPLYISIPQKRRRSSTFKAPVQDGYSDTIDLAKQLYKHLATQFDLPHIQRIIHEIVSQRDTLHTPHSTHSASSIIVNTRWYRMSQKSPLHCLTNPCALRGQSTARASGRTSAADYVTYQLHATWPSKLRRSMSAKE